MKGFVAASLLAILLSACGNPGDMPPMVESGALDVASLADG
jgi:hypothetical protein